MPVMNNVQEVRKAITALQKLRKKSEANDNVKVIVGYTAQYAIYVHEDLNARHAPGKQAKYLEAPARQHRRRIGNIVSTTYAKTKSMRKALIMGALFLKRESQKIVPVDTSNLKGSAFDPRVEQ